MELDLEKLKGKVVYIPKGRNSKKPKIKEELLDRLNAKGEPLTRNELRDVARKFGVSLSYVGKIHLELVRPEGRTPTQNQVRAVISLVEELGGSTEGLEDFLYSLTRKQVQVLTLYLSMRKTLRKHEEKGFVRKLLKVAELPPA